MPFYQTGVIHLTVLSGDLYINSGMKFNNNSKGIKLPHGSYLTILPNEVLYMWTQKQGVIIQMHSDKVSAVKYL